MSEILSSPQLSNARVAVLSVIVTAISGIAIAFVGILPQIRQAPAAASPLVDAVTPVPAGDDPSEKAWKITGRVTDAGGKGYPSQIFLTPADYQTSSGDLGEFVFEHVQAGHYSVVVRSPSTTVATFIEVMGTVDKEKDFEALQVSYSVNQQ